MKICDTVVMFYQEAPDLQGVLSVAVEGPVDKFHLLDFSVQKILQFPFYQLKTPQTHLFLYGRQAVTAPERTAATRLII